MLRRLTTLAALTALAVFGSLLAAGSAAAQEQGWWYSHPRGYSNSSSSSYSPPAYYYAPPPSSYAPASPNADASYFSPSNFPQGVSGYYTPSDSVNDRATQVSLRVPANAEVWFDGNPTQQRGERRTFVSPPLDSDKTMHYEVRARWVDANGQKVEQTRRVAVRAGQLSMVDFLRPESTESKPKP
jgi:uncharacterized protein (TIGR03000 family)